MYLMAIGVLEAKQKELIEMMQDKSKEPTQKLAYTLMYDDCSEAIKVLNKAFFEHRPKE